VPVATEGMPLHDVCAAGSAAVRWPREEGMSCFPVMGPRGGGDPLLR
jgi:hypothetical protein